MRFLFVNNHCISDPTAGVTQSLRTIMEWLADAGHACHVLTTARFESPVTFTIEEHLGQFNPALKGTTLRGTLRHGNSGGPAVDGNGAVETTVFAARVGGGGGFGVASSAVRIDLASAKGPVSTGPCAP